MHNQIWDSPLEGGLLRVHVHKLDDTKRADFRHAAMRTVLLHHEGDVLHRRGPEPFRCRRHIAPTYYRYPLTLTPVRFDEPIAIKIEVRYLRPQSYRFSCYFSRRSNDSWNNRSLRRGTCRVGFESEREMLKLVHSVWGIIFCIISWLSVCLSFYSFVS